ncbi:hypothetical protein E4P42_10375 [Mycobacterium sp. PS03-16]|nr:hypothetical protein E4P42_10375 [Mycobacterium sp. PS03-16]
MGTPHDWAPYSSSADAARVYLRDPDLAVVHHVAPQRPRRVSRRRSPRAPGGVARYRLSASTTPRRASARRPISPITALLR